MNERPALTTCVSTSTGVSLITGRRNWACIECRRVPFGARTAAARASIISTTPPKSGPISPSAGAHTTITPP